MAAKKKVKKLRDALAVLNAKLGPLTFGNFLESIRMTDEYSAAAMARKLGISSQNLCDIEKGRKGVSPERAAKWARLLGYSEAQFVQLALQAEVTAAGLKYSVEIKAA